MKTDTCNACRAGTRNLCHDVNVIVSSVYSSLLKFFISYVMQGIGGFGGGLAEYIAVNEKFVHILPNNISRSWADCLCPWYSQLTCTVFLVEVGACIEPLAVAWYAVKKSNFKSGDRVLICGAGPVGSCPYGFFPSQFHIWIHVDRDFPAQSPAVRILCYLFLLHMILTHFQLVRLDDPSSYLRTHITPSFGQPRSWRHPCSGPKVD